MSIISDERAEKALRYLVEDVDASAAARADRHAVEKYRESLKARLMKECGAESAAAQEREALAHPDYLQHLEAIKHAVFLDEKHRFKREVEMLVIEMWRTEQANARSAEKVR